MRLLHFGAFGLRTFLDKDGDGGTGDEGDEKKPIPYAEHRKVRQLLAKAKADLEAANVKIGEFEKKAPDVAKIAAERDEAIGRANNAEKDVQLRDLGVTDPDDRAFIRERYNMTTNGAKDAPEFGDWLGAQREKRWFKSMIPDAPEADGDAKGDEPRSEYAANKGKAPEQGAGKSDEKKPEQGARGAPTSKPAFNPNAGTRGASGAPGGGARPAFTREEIAGMSPDDYRANRDAIRDAQRSGRIE